jgi:hypothetical protein
MIISEICKIFGCGQGQASNALKRLNIPICHDFSMKNNPAWKGGRRIDADGYVQIRKEGRYYLEHRLVMEKYLSRKLTKKEVVHHKNGNKQDNRIENLVLFSSNGVHLGVELLGKIPNWTKDGLRRIRSRSVPSMKGTRQCKRGTGVRKLRRKQIQKFLHDTSDLHDIGLEAKLELPPTPPRKKKKK